MTYREKLAIEHPEGLDDQYEGGCSGCPQDYGYEDFSICGGNGCDDCWSREMESSEVMAGKYRDAIQEKRFEYKGFPCVVVMQCGAFRTGYVGLPFGHKYYGVDYENIPIECHGGLTYSSSYLVDQEDENIWWIGFDTAHYMDGHDYVGAMELFKDYPKSVEMMKQAMMINIFKTDCYAFSLKMMEEELENIVNQLLIV